MAFDYSKLRGRIIEKCGTRAEFARRMGLSERSISLKLNNRNSFDQDDIVKACAVLDIPRTKVNTYFFAE